MAVAAGCLWVVAILLGFVPARAEEGMARTARVPALATPGVCYATLGSTSPNGGSLITIDLVTGAGTLIGPTGIAGALNDVGVPALAIKSTGEMYALDIGPSANLYQIDAVTGSATLVATTGLSSPPAAAFDGNNMLYVTDSGGSLFTVDDVTGGATLVGATGIFPKGFDFSPVTGVLWATDASSRVYTINPLTAVPTLVGNTGQNPSPDLAFDQSGALFASSGGGLAPNNLLSIDTGTGVGTIIGSIGFYPVSGMSARLDRVVPTGVSGKDGRAPGLVLQQNYPNPFNPSTTMVYIVSEHGLVTVAIYDVNGATVATLVRRDHAPGSYSARWNGRSQSGEVMPSGVYFARVSHNGTVRSRKIVLLK